jgi:hypothetical protein
VSGFYRHATRRLFRSPERGADTLVWLASAAPGTWPSGEYFMDRRIKRPTREARHPELATELWDRSLLATGLK